MLAQVLGLRADQPGEHTEIWQVSNESPGGLALRREGDSVTSATVGEVVGIRHPGVANWQPGVVRWMHDQHDALLECGVQILAPAYQVVSFSVNDRPEGEVHRGLLLPAMAALGRPALLLAARGTFQPGREGTLNGADGELSLRMLRMDDHTQQVELIDFELS